jgi:predicted enzyme related to lactoylglutathione lyase
MNDSATGVASIGGMFLYANDPAALSAWYSAHLGMTFETYTEAPDTKPQYYVEYFIRDDADPTRRISTVFAIRPVDPPLGSQRRECMINFRVDDLDALLARLKAQGIAVENRFEYSFGRFAHIRDPEGYRIELYQPL